MIRNSLPSSAFRQDEAARLKAACAEYPDRPLARDTHLYQRELDVLASLGADPFVTDYGAGSVIEATCGVVDGPQGQEWMIATFTNNLEALASDRTSGGHWQGAIQGAGPDGDDAFDDGIVWAQGEGNDIGDVYRTLLSCMWQNRANYTPADSVRAGEVLVHQKANGVAVSPYRFGGATVGLLNHIASQGGPAASASADEVGDRNPRIRRYFDAHPDEGFLIIDNPY